MKVIVNTKPIIIPDDTKVIELLDYIESPRAVAIFINNKQLLYSQYNEYILKENDNIRIIRPLGGG